MEDLFSKTLWSMAAKNPELREQLILSQSEELGLYSMPTRYTVDYILSLKDDHPIKEDYLEFSEMAKQMTIAEVNDLLLLLRDHALTKEASGEALNDFDLVLRDVDLLAFVTMILVWIAYSEMEDEPETT